MPFRSFLTRQVKSKVIRFFLKHKFLARLFWFSGLYSMNFKEDLLILIYQMGKVGSQTINNSLRPFGLPVYHLHWLKRDKLIEHLKEKHVTDRTQYLQILKHGVSFLSHINYSEMGLERKKWKIISLIREPVARNVSVFFHFIKKWFPRYVRKYKTKHMTNDKLRDFFLENFSRHNLPLSWFDKEMKQVFKIDIFSEEFPKSKGYKIYTGNHTDLLLLKLEKLNNYASEAIKKFLGIDNFVLQDTNLARDQFYHSLYHEFISSRILPRSYVEKMYNSKYAKHFYSEEELNTFRKKWKPETINIDT